MTYEQALDYMLLEAGPFAALEYNPTANCYRKVPHRHRNGVERCEELRNQHDGGKPAPWASEDGNA